MCDLDHPVLVGAKNIDNWHARKGHLQCAFPLGIPMLPSSSIVVAADGEHVVDSPSVKPFAMGTLSSSLTTSAA
jgi:hypothetical protein